MNETTMISMRMDNVLLSKIDSYCSSNPIFSRSYMISRIVDAVLRTADEDDLFFILSSSPKMLESFELHIKQKFEAVFGEN